MNSEPFTRCTFSQPKLIVFTATNSTVLNRSLENDIFIIKLFGNEFHIGMIHLYLIQC